MSNTSTGKLRCGTQRRWCTNTRHPRGMSRCRRRDAASTCASWGSRTSRKYPGPLGTSHTGPCPCIALLRSAHHDNRKINHTQAHKARTLVSGAARAVVAIRAGDCAAVIRESTNGPNTNFIAHRNTHHTHKICTYRPQPWCYPPGSRNRHWSESPPRQCTAHCSWTWRIRLTHTCPARTL